MDRVRLAKIFRRWWKEGALLRRVRSRDEACDAKTRSKTNRNDHVAKYGYFLSSRSYEDEDEKRW